MHDTDPKPGGTPSAQPDDVTAITLTRLPSGRWSAHGDSCVGSGETRQEALSELEAFCDGFGPKPPTHWFFAAVRLVERAQPGAAIAVLARLVAC